MHGPVEQQWLLHCHLSPGFQVSALSVKQAEYRRARCSHTALLLIFVRAQDHQPIQLLACPPNTKIPACTLTQTQLRKSKSIQELQGDKNRFIAPVGTGNYFLFLS
ncbi:hypothetical protein PBY51_016984 [Eleginops maclovinus]|uniref:Uncharacterized protein n=1 Tax=Eleginops maclovinus TaxID=56733 RepID=A0AAN7WNG5_ELEMC|nr:hypothetical protein PBY51_016984 [Eleginops maclovinus]